MTTKPTCEDLIFDRLQSRLNDIEAYRTAEDDDKREALETELTQNVLSVSQRKTFDVLLSYGGPSDGFRITVADNNDFYSGEYYYQDWFDGATRSLSEDEAQAVCELYGLWEVQF